MCLCALIGRLFHTYKFQKELARDEQYLWHGARLSNAAQELAQRWTGDCTSDDRLCISNAGCSLQNISRDPSPDCPELLHEMRRHPRIQRQSSIHLLPIPTWHDEHHRWIFQKVLHATMCESNLNLALSPWVVEVSSSFRESVVCNT